MQIRCPLYFQPLCLEPPESTRTTSGNFLPTNLRNRGFSAAQSYNYGDWWNSKPLLRPLRTILVLYAFLTVVATLGSGQHYLVDLLVSLPFALAVQAATSYEHPDKRHLIAAAV